MPKVPEKIKMTPMLQTGQNRIPGIEYGSALKLRMPVEPVTLFAVGAIDSRGYP